MKKIITLLASAALIASGLSIVPAAASEEAPAVPEVANIEDPFGDANTMSGDQVTPADGGSVSDLGKVWFTHNEDDLSVHFLTEGPPGANTVGLKFAVTVGEGGCAVIDGYFAGLTYTSDNYGRLVDNCNSLDPIDGTFAFGEGPDGSGLATITVPRSASPVLADGSVLTAPTAGSWIFAGGDQITPSGYRGIQQRVDDTQPGTSYAISSPTDVDTPPGKNPVPGKKKGCDNGKGKKRGCEGKGKKAPKKGKPAKSCTPIAPSTSGAEAPHVTLTDEHTADAPLAQPVELEQRFDEGLTGANPSSVNVTVDTDNEEVGLYATLEFPARRDYDLWAYFPGTEDEEAASSHGFNPLIETQGLPAPADQSNTASNHGGETTASSENLVGILTPDCGGYTVSAYTYFGEGGELELKLWLGEVSYDPAETGGERALLSIYDSLMTFM